MGMLRLGTVAWILAVAGCDAEAVLGFTPDMSGCGASGTCPAGTVCDARDGTCVGCLDDSGCAAPAPHCAPDTNRCVGCLSDEQCPVGSACHARECSPGCSASRPSCPEHHVCHLAAGVCVECLDDGDCKGADRPRCEPRDKRCVACLPANDNCAAGQFCAGTACQPGCRTDRDCPGGTQCDVGAHTCVGCVNDGGCPAGQLCASTRCVAGCNLGHACPTGQGCCGGSCAQLLADPANCGACGRACAQGAACCNGSCDSLATVTNCGACGNVCGPGADCCGGSCAQLASSRQNCGACGNACPGALSCQAGKCVCLGNADCARGESCCGGACVAGDCCSNTDCGDGRACQAHLCGPDPGMLAWFKLDEGKGTSCADSSSYSPIFNTPAVLKGVASWTTGVRNKALFFDGGSAVVIPDYYAPNARYVLSGMAAITAEAWVYPEDAGGQLGGRYGSIIERGCDDHWALRMGGDLCNGFFCAGHLLAGVRVANGTYFQIGSPNPLPPKTWTHVAMSHDGATLSIYVNGKLVASTPAAGDLTPPGVGASGTKKGSASIDPTIGGRYCGGGVSDPNLSYFYTGQIDEVRVYNYARSPSDIAFDAIP